MEFPEVQDANTQRAVTGRDGANRYPSIAAVTLNFGSPDDTFECVRSLQASQYPDLRVIVVDNGSSAENRDRLRRNLPNAVTFIQSETNLGFAGGNNVGMRRALQDGADYVLLINNDATIKRDALEVLADAAGGMEKLGILGGKIVVADEKGPTAEIWSAGGWYSPWRASGYMRGQGEADRGQYEKAEDTSFIPACFWFVPAGVLCSTGLLAEDFFLYAEDLDYTLRLRRAGYRIRYEPRAICYHKVSRSHWRNRKRASPLLNYYTNRNRMLIARKWLPPPKRALFYVYFTASRLISAVLHRDLSYFNGLWDGMRGRTGPVRSGG